MVILSPGRTSEFRTQGLEVQTSVLQASRKDRHQRKLARQETGLQRGLLEWEWLSGRIPRPPGGNQALSGKRVGWSAGGRSRLQALPAAGAPACFPRFLPDRSQVSATWNFMRGTSSLLLVSPPIREVITVAPFNIRSSVGVISFNLDHHRLRGVLPSYSFHRGES